MSLYASRENLVATDLPIEPQVAPQDSPLVRVSPAQISESGEVRDAHGVVLDLSSLDN